MEKRGGKREWGNRDEEVVILYIFFNIFIGV